MFGIPVIHNISAIMLKHHIQFTAQLKTLNIFFDIMVPIIPHILKMEPFIDMQINISLKNTFSKDPHRSYHLIGSFYKYSFQI